MKIPAIFSNPYIVYGAKFVSSAGLISGSSILAKEVYDLSIAILQGRTHCPYFLISSLALGSIASAYCSWKISPFHAESPASLKSVPAPRWLRPQQKAAGDEDLAKAQQEKLHREIVAFDPGELAAPSKEVQS